MPLKWQAFQEGRHPTEAELAQQEAESQPPWYQKLDDSLGLGRHSYAEAGFNWFAEGFVPTEPGEPYWHVNVNGSAVGGAGITGGVSIQYYGDGRCKTLLYGGEGVGLNGGISLTFGPSGFEPGHHYVYVAGGTDSPIPWVGPAGSLTIWDNGRGVPLNKSWQFGVGTDAMMKGGTISVNHVEVWEVEWGSRSWRALLAR